RGALGAGGRHQAAVTPPPPPPPLHPARRDAGPTRRAVVSFVRRGERLTPSRRDSWDRLSPEYVLDPPRGERDTLPADGARLDLEEAFGRRAELVVEVGSGLGEDIVAAATAHPERDHLG